MQNLIQAARDPMRMVEEVEDCAGLYRGELATAVVRGKEEASDGFGKDLEGVEGLLELLADELADARQTIIF
jgi:hypothetical protein